MGSPAFDGGSRELVGHCVELLRAGNSVELFGLPGSGRSSALAATIARLREAGTDVVLVRGLKVLRERPFAALALAGVEVPPSPPHAAMFASLSNAICPSRPGNLVIAVDDADHLDTATAGVLLAAATEMTVPTIITRRPVAQPAAGWARPGIRLTLPAMTYEALHSMVLDHLPGTVDSTGMARLVGMSGGLPGLLRAMIDAGRITGEIALSGSVWVVGSELWTPGVGSVLDRFVEDLEAHDLDGLEMLAQAEGSTPVVPVPDAVVRRLHRAGLLVASDSPDDSPRVYPPLLAEHVRRSLGDDPRPIIDSSAVTIVTPVRLMEHWHAELSQARAAWIKEPTTATAGPLLAALHQLSVGPEAIIDVIASTDPRSGSAEDQAGFAVAHALALALELDELAQADRVLDEAALQLPRYQGLFAAIGAHAHYVGERVGSNPQSVARDEHLHVDRIGLHALVRVESLVARGQIDDARDHLGHPGDGGWLTAELELCRGLAALLEGDVDGAIRIAVQCSTRASEQMDGPSLEIAGYLHALSLFVAGRSTELTDHLGRVLAVAQAPQLQRHFRQGSLTIAASNALDRGYPSLAFSLLTQAESLGIAGGPLPGMAPRIATHVAAALRDPADDSAVREMWEIAVDRLERGYVVHATILAVRLAERWSAPAQAARPIIAAVRDSQSRVLRALGAYLDALGEQEARALEDVAGDLQAAGLIGFAARAEIEAARRYRRAANAVAGARAAARGWKRMSDVGLDGLREALRDSGAEIGLTAREWEIVHLAAAGLGNVELARRLSVSVRTVESHMSSALRKVGVEGREELRVALETWLGAARGGTPKAS